MAISIHQGSRLLESERELLSVIIGVLKQRYENLEDFCYLFVGYECNGRQIDATLIKSNAILNIEIKNYSGEKAIATAQGDLIIEPRQERLSRGRGETPIGQVSQQNFALKNFIFDNQSELFGGKAIATTDDIDICGVIVLRKIKQVDLSALGSKRAFLRVTDTEKFQKDISSYQGRDFVKRNLPLDLEQGFAKELAHLLDLKNVDEIEIHHIDQDTETEDAFREYLSGIEFKKADYFHRPEIEGKLLDERNIILIGAPGAGKSTMLDMIIANHAKQELEKKRLSQIPCLLRLVGNEYILQKVASEVGTPENVIEKYLDTGKFWIVFDGVDEMHDFRTNFPNITDFIGRYRKNKYIISVRREYFENSLYKEEFISLNKLSKDKRFEQVDVIPLLPQELSNLLELRLEEQFTEDSKAKIEIFLCKLPEITPLTFEMAVEIHKGGGKLLYENEGKWFEQFFELKLKRECNKVKVLGRDAENLLNDVLTMLGKYVIEESDSFFEKSLVRSFINDKTGDKQLEYYDLLFRSEILEPVTVDITNGKHIKTEEQLQFHHKTYRDFYVAKSLIGKLNDYDLLEEVISNSEEYESIIMLCGIERQESINNKIILTAFDFGNIELSLECLCHTANHSFKLVSDMADRLIKKAESDSYYKKYQILKYVDKYGDRICTPEFQNYLETVTQSNIIRKTDWEIIKSTKLGIGEIPEFLKKIPYYVYKCDSTRGKYIESCSRLANKVESQNLDGYNFFLKLKDIHSADELLDLALDESYNSCFRSELLWDIRNECRERRLKGKYVLSKIKKFSEIWNNQCEEYRWGIIPFYLYLDELHDEHEISTSEEENIANEVIEIFWKENSGPVQLRIILGAPHIPDLMRVKFYEDILSHYSNDSVFDLQRLALILEEEFFDEVDWACTEEEDGSPYIANYNRSAFRNETYTTLIKCITMDYGLFYYSKYLKSIDPKFKGFLVQYSFSENEKLRTVAEWALDKLEKQSY